MRVLYTPLNEIGIGGLSTIAYRLGTNMDKEKVQVDFFATYKILDDSYRKIVKQQNGKIYDFNVNANENKIKKKILLIKNFYKILKQNKYDIIHVHIDSSYSGFIFGIVTKFTGKSKIIFHSHNTAISGRLRKIMHIIFKPTLLFLGDEFIACSTEAGKWMYSKNILKNNKIKIIENGVNIEKYAFDENVRNEYREKLNLKNNFTIGHIGRFVTQKNHEFLIDIFYEIYKKNRNTKLILVGVGELENRIKQKVDSLKLNNNVLFLGARNDVENLLQAFDLFLLPSLYEGLPIVAIESQAAGLNTILSDSITKETKIISNVEYISLNKNAEFWADTILKFNKEYDRKKYKNEILESNFNIRKSALNLQEFYFKIINKE